MNSILVDSREPWPHPWAAYSLCGAMFTRNVKETTAGLRASAADICPDPLAWVLALA